MSIHELDENDLHHLPPSINGKIAVLFYTPLCGTCKLAERMLDIAMAAGISTPLYKANINFTPRLREKWQIESIPCLLVLKNGSPILKEYAMKSVDHLHSILK